MERKGNFFSRTLLRDTADGAHRRWWHPGGLLDRPGTGYPEDEIPGFNQRTLAIIGVPDGSLGAMVITSVVSRRVAGRCHTGCLKRFKTIFWTSR
ncbi:MAG: hypothetical protein OEZ10_11125 [Gammaproteobacteria bacterium]|nr:hypothetical protein [Gammaproteobacteria bacterium]